MNRDTEFAVVGGGVVGLSIAYGLLLKGKSVSVFDEGDTALRASRGNFGLIWVQGKGADRPDYARWTRESAKRWRDFADTLSHECTTDLKLEQRGGYSIFLDEQSLTDRAASLARLKHHLNADYPFEILSHNALKKEEPHIGPKVTGAIFHQEDGHVNSLVLLRSLAKAVRQRGGNILTRSRIKNIKSTVDGFALTTDSNETFLSERVVLAAGLGTKRLGQSLGFKVPVRPQRGQVLITEKMPRIINRPSDEIRQVDEGGIQIGASAEEVGENDAETLRTTAQLANNAIKQYPILANATLVRSWGALRILSPDGYPIYQQSLKYPGAYFATCHSGITLAAAHAQLLPDWLCDAKKTFNCSGEFSLETFSEERFNA